MMLTSVRMFLELGNTKHELKTKSAKPPSHQVFNNKDTSMHLESWSKARNPSAKRWNKEMKTGSESWKEKRFGRKEGRERDLLASLLGMGWSGQPKPYWCTLPSQIQPTETDVTLTPSLNRAPCLFAKRMYRAYIYASLLIFLGYV